MTNYVNPVSELYLSNTCYTNCQNITHVNLHNIPWVNNSMFNAFYNCKSLVGVSNISSSVTNMYSTFWGCSNLVNTPIIPNRVTHMHFTFSYCSNLVNAPSIPNSVTSMYRTFQSCSSLVNAPVIPDSVTNMSGTFIGCTNLIGNIYIYSENITNTTDCFNNTSLRKNVYIPFKYDNGVNTTTYNAFINAGYTTTGTTDSVYLKDINGIQSGNGTNIDISITINWSEDTMYTDTYTIYNADNVKITEFTPTKTAGSYTFVVNTEDLPYYYGTNPEELFDYHLRMIDTHAGSFFYTSNMNNCDIEQYDVNIYIKILDLTNPSVSFTYENND